MNNFPARARALARPLLVAAAAAAIPAVAAAQQSITTPRVSPAASVSQTVGINQIEIQYHRPAINGRKVWGSLVPYGQVWRCGANDNTTISFTHPVKVEGKELAAGSYGLHMLPTETDWTLIFSTNSTSWGSFTYDDKEDAARVTVTPIAAPSEERLVYGFDDPTESSAIAYLHWEKLKVPFEIEVDTHEQVLANAQLELRHLPRFNWLGWSQAASYAEQHGMQLEEALTWVDRSLAREQNFRNMSVKARLLDRLGRGDEATELRKQALEVATENELNGEGYRLMGLGKTADAMAVFKRNAAENPSSWNVHDSLAECLAQTGDKKAAKAAYEKALSLAPDAQKERIKSVLANL